MNRLDRIIKIIREVPGIDLDTPIDINTKIEDLHLDSLNFIEIIMAIEEEFEIEFSDDVMEGATIVGDLYNEVLEQDE